MKEKKLRRAKGASSSKCGDAGEPLELWEQHLATSGKSDDNVEFDPFVFSEKSGRR